MDVLNLKTAEIHNLDAGQANDVEQQIRRQLAEIRMDIYTAPAIHTGKKRKLKKTLARLLTIRPQVATFAIDFGPHYEFRKFELQMRAPFSLLGLLPRTTLSRLRKYQLVSLVNLMMQTECMASCCCSRKPDGIV